MSDKRDRTWRRQHVEMDDQPEYYAPVRTAPEPGPAADGQVLNAVVRRFNLAKGFGFVAFADGSPDAFLHASKITGDRALLAAGTRLSVRVGTNARGREVTEVISIEPTTTVTVQGAVKWYDVTKGFGFIVPDDGSPDLFVHVSALERSGLAKRLVEDQRVEVGVVDCRKGREVHTVKIIN